MLNYGSEHFDCRWQRIFGKYEDDEADYVDSVSRAIFPFIFVIFNMVYWVYYRLIFTKNPSFDDV